MSLLVTFADVWASVEGGFTSFITHPAVKQLGIWLDNGMVAVALVVYFKYIRPKLNENEELRKTKDEWKKAFYQSLSLVDATVKDVTGINLRVEERVNGLMTVINTAFQSSNLDAKAKTIIQATVQQMILGQPVDLKAAVASIGEEGAKVMSEVQEAVESIVKETRSSALEELAKTAFPEQEV